MPDQDRLLRAGSPIAVIGGGPEGPLFHDLLPETAARFGLATRGDVCVTKGSQARGIRVHPAHRQTPGIVDTSFHGGVDRPAGNQRAARQRSVGRARAAPVSRSAYRLWRTPGGPGLNAARPDRTDCRGPHGLGRRPAVSGPDLLRSRAGSRRRPQPQSALAGAPGAAGYWCCFWMFRAWIPPGRGRLGGF
jgi:hypothetical protein